MVSTFEDPPPPPNLKQIKSTVKLTCQTVKSTVLQLSLSNKIKKSLIISFSKMYNKIVL